VRIGLIAIGETGAQAEAGALAGRTLARHQLDFALAQGCEKIIALGYGASKEGVAAVKSGLWFATLGLYPAGEMAACPVSKMVNSPANDTARLLERI